MRRMYDKKEIQDIAGGGLYKHTFTIQRPHGEDTTGYYVANTSERVFEYGSGPHGSSVHFDGTVVVTSPYMQTGFGYGATVQVRAKFENDSRKYELVKENGDSLGATGITNYTITKL